jgi:predicted phage baseplate assembly protein
VTVQFGNGVTGARLPTGVENVGAVYRVGTGLDGQVDAGQLTLLMSRPLGVRDVRNPLPATGAEDAERLDDARVNAPLTVLTLDRVVSLLDYEDFARAFAGIGKAAVTLLWTGEQQTVHLTVGLADGSAPTDTSRTLADLRGALDGSRHALRPVLVQGYHARPFRVAAKVAVEADHETAAVLTRVRDALLAEFAFANRSFAQEVTESEVVAVMQGVRGVGFVDLDTLAFVGGAAAVGGRLPARPARLEGGAVEPAELLTLVASDVQLTARAP